MEILDVSFQFSDIKDQEQEADLFDRRILDTRTIDKTHRLHFVLPISMDLVKVNEFSTSKDARIDRVTNLTESSKRALDIKGYVTEKYDGQ